MTAGKNPTKPSNPPAQPDATPPSRTGKAGLTRWVLLAAGIAAWLWADGGLAAGALTSILPIAFAAVAIVGVGVPGVRRWLDAKLDSIRHPQPRSRALAATAICVTAAAVLFLAAYAGARDLFPRMHDEFSYLLGAQMLARGRLWMPTHPLADFFESFHILVRPVYASIYFPGTAMLHVPAVWLGLATWLTPLVLVGATIGMTYRVATELFDGVAGILASLLVVAAASIRWSSTLVLSQMPAALLGLLLLWAWLRWRHERRARWAAMVGAFAGWFAITRPVDALAFALPLGIAMTWQLRHAPWKAWATTGGILLAAAAPFLALQLVFNVGVTGRPLLTPYVMYLQQNQPGSEFGEIIEFDPTGAPQTRPTTELPQKQLYYADLAAQEAFARSGGTLDWLAGRLTTTLHSALATPLLLAFVPVALLRIGRSGVAVVCAIPLLFLAMYTFNWFFLGHYVLPLMPVMAMWIVAGAAALGGAGGPNVWTSTTLLAISLACLPGLNPAVSDEHYQTPLLALVNSELQNIETPAVVLFRFDPRSTVHEEPVYNSDVAWPDDAPIIRAHDLGPRNAELIRYYDTHGLTRTFYLFDRGAARLVPLGSADEALKRLSEYNSNNPN